MPPSHRYLSAKGRSLIDAAAAKYGVSTQAVSGIFGALVRSGGRQVQMSHPDLGGFVQWLSGGMIMIGETINEGLRVRVGALCDELAVTLPDPSLFEPFPRGSDSANAGQG